MLNRYNITPESYSIRQLCSDAPTREKIGYPLLQQDFRLGDKL